MAVQFHCIHINIAIPHSREADDIFLEEIQSRASLENCSVVCKKKKAYTFNITFQALSKKLYLSCFFN